MGLLFMQSIILFDGECNLCSQSVQFIIKRDQHSCFKFASLQSEFGVKRLQERGLDHQLKSIVLIRNNRVYIKSAAILRICKDLGGGWKFMALFLIIPAPIRDVLYNFVTKNRYKWFGKRESCMFPSKEMKDKFLK